MKYLAGVSAALSAIEPHKAAIQLFSRSSDPTVATAGAAILDEVRKRKYTIPQAAWDFLTIALAAVVVDGATPRKTSPDGWTRVLDMRVALNAPEEWAQSLPVLESAMNFLTTDVWGIEAVAGGAPAPAPTETNRPIADGAALLSGGLDSLIGAIDLTAQGITLLAVSQTVRGDSDKQEGFAARIGGGLDLLQLNHNASTPRSDKETSQRSRSLIFLAFALIAACSTAKYEAGQTVPIYLSENGFIAINPPLTDARLGSLSTRTAHPAFLSKIQAVFDNMGLHVRIVNSYSEKTKGEMLKECVDQAALRREAVLSTSCGRFQRYNYRHCGRCIPCQIRRAAFLEWGNPDTTNYVFDRLGRRDPDHARFDDVMSSAMAIATVDEVGLDRWIGTSLSAREITNAPALRLMVGRGIEELRTLHSSLGVW